MAAESDFGNDTDINRRLSRTHPVRTGSPQLHEFGVYHTVASEEMGSNQASGIVTSKRYRIARLILEFVIGAWLSYCSIRYLVAAVVYHNDDIRFGVAVSFAIVSIIATVAIALVILLEIIKGYFYDTLVFFTLISTASVILFGLCIANVILVSVFRRPSDPTDPDMHAHAIQGRCTWDVDVIWTGTGMACGNGMHIWSLYLVAAILRLIVTAAVLVLFIYLARRARTMTSLERPLRPSKIKHARSSSMMSLFTRRPRNNTVSSGVPNSTVTTALTSPPLGEPDDLDVAGLPILEERDRDRDRIVSFSFGGHHPSSSASSGSSRASSAPTSPTSSFPRFRGHRRSLSIDSPFSLLASEPILSPDAPVPGSRSVLLSPNVPDLLDFPSQSPHASPRMPRAVNAEDLVFSPTREQWNYTRSPAEGFPPQSRSQYLQLLSSRAKVRPIVQILGGDVEKMSTIESVSSQDQSRSGRISGNGWSEVDSISSLGQWIPPTLGLRDWNERPSSSSTPPSPPWSQLAAPGNTSPPC